MHSLVLNIEAELLFLFGKHGLELLVCAPHGLALEEAVHLLQGNTACLGDEEEGEEEGEEGEGGEEHVDSVAHGCEHLFCEAGDEEVEEPVAGCCAGLGERSEVGVEEFLWFVS